MMHGTHNIKKNTHTHTNNFLQIGIYAFYTIHTSLLVLTHFLQFVTFKKALIKFRACKEHTQLDWSDI